MFIYLSVIHLHCNTINTISSYRKLSLLTQQGPSEEDEQCHTKTIYGVELNKYGICQYFSYLGTLAEIFVILNFPGNLTYGAIISTKFVRQ